MSNGAFVDSIYQADTGALYNCRVQPETLTADISGTANAPAAGPVPSGQPSAIMSSGRKNGINARTVRMQVTTAGTSPFAVGTIQTIPAMTEAWFNLAQRGVSISYQGATCRFVGKTQENIV